MSSAPLHGPPTAAEPNGTIRDRISDGLTRAGALLGAADDASRAKRNALIAFTIRVASAFLAYVIQVMLARWLGGFEYGIYVFVWSIVLIFGGMASLGFTLSVARFIPEYAAAGDAALARGLHRASRWIPFAVSTATALAAAAMVHLAGDRLIESYYLVPLILAFACVPVFTLLDVHDGIGRAHDWIGLALLPPYIIRPLILLALIIGAHMAGFSASAETAMFCAIAAIWITALGQTIVINRRLSTTLKDGPRLYETRKWLAVSMPIFLVDGFFLFMTNTDVLLLSLLRTPEETGTYFAAVKTLAFVAFVSFSVAAAYSHKFSEFHARGEREKLEGFVRSAVVWTFWPSLFGCAVLLVFGKPLLSLFGDGFSEAYPVMFVIAAGMMARALVGPLERLMNVTGHQNRCARIYTISFLMNIALNLLLIPAYGIIGAAVATAAAYCLESILLAHSVRRHLGLRVMIWDRS